MENSKDQEIAKSDNSKDGIHIGSDELVEILTWMPAKQVIKFSSLSKTIHSLISKPSFGKTQCIRSSAIASSAGGVIFHRSGKLGFHSLAEEDGGIPDESLSFISQTGFLIMASSQGLLLLGKCGSYYDSQENKKELLICNPTTRRWAPLAIPQWLESRTWYYPFARPHLECHTTNLNSSNLADGYTVIIPVLKDPQPTSVTFTFDLAVYRNGKWEEGMCDLPSLGEGGPLEAAIPVCLFNGWNGGLVIHYLCVDVDADWSIVAYDVGRNAFLRNFKLPEEYSWSLSRDMYAMRLRLFKWRSSSSRCETIAVVNKSQHHHKDDYLFTVWVLEDYEGGSWTRMFQKTTPEMGVMGKPRVRSFLLVMNPMGMGLVFATRDRVYAYQLDGPQSGRLQMMGEPGYGVVKMELIHYINTLRPVGGGETQSI